MTHSEKEFFHHFNQSLQNDAVQVESPSVFWQAIHIQKSNKIWQIFADNRPIKTPMQHELIAPNLKVAELIKKEWDMQNNVIRPRLMPISRLVMTIIDKLSPDDDLRQNWLSSAYSYMETDFILFPSTYPQSLKEAEYSLWQPVINWANDFLNHDFKANENFDINSHNKKALPSLIEKIETYNIWQQMGFVVLCQSCGSALLALAAAENIINEETLIKASLVQEHHQSKQWGEDDELTAQIENKSFELKSLYQFLQSFSDPELSY